MFKTTAVLILNEYAVQVTCPLFYARHKFVIQKYSVTAFQVTWPEFDILNYTGSFCLVLGVV